MNYHNVIIDLLHYILNKPDEYRVYLESGNAYDKIIRNYHQFNYKGEKVYRNKNRILNHYRFTEDAWKVRNKMTSLYYEHLIPIKIIKDDLIKSNKTIQSITKILNDNEIIVLTKSQALELDKEYKSTIPKNGISRLDIMNYKIEQSTQNNTLWKK